jgi:hypothetical protein
MQPSNPDKKPLRSAWLTGGAMVALIAAFYMLREHWTHVAGVAWPYLLLLACPVMHLLMHRRHGRDGQGH